MFHNKKWRLPKTQAINDVSNLMKYQSSLLTKRFGRKINYAGYTDYSIDISDYAYHPNDANGDYIRIGQSGVKEYSSLFGKDYIDIIDYARMILNVYHESQHAIQCNDVFNTSDSFAQVQAIENIAGYNNPEYYVCGGNYQINLSEIDAEHSGFLALKAYLSKTVGEDMTKEIIVNLVNQKISDSDGRYFIKNTNGQFSIDDENVMERIDDAFADAYAASFDTWKRYDLDGPIPDMLLEMGIDKPDAFKEYVKTDKKARSVYEHARTREEQDLVVAAINCKLHPEYKHYFKCLENVDLSYEHVIEERYAELVNEGKVEPDKIYERKYEEAHERLFGDNSTKDSEKQMFKERDNVQPKLHNNRRLPNIIYDDDADKQTQLE